MSVGLVLGTRESSPLEFWVGVEEGEYLQLDDLVTVQTEVPGKNSEQSLRWRSKS